MLYVSEQHKRDLAAKVRLRIPNDERTPGTKQAYMLALSSAFRCSSERALLDKAHCLGRCFKVVQTWSGMNKRKNATNH